MSSWASFGVALVALAQVWVVGLWRKFFRRGDIDILETGQIEIGYSTLGPTLALHGTLRAVHKDQFVREVAVTVVRDRDAAQHDFRWQAFRGGQAGQEGSAVELPASFLISTAQPYRYNIFFSDFETRRDIEALIAPVRDAWQKKLTDAQPADADARNALYTEFRGDPAFYNAHAELGRALYWNAGSYTLSMAVHSTRPEKAYTQTWRFSLTADNVAALKLNVIAILAFACGFTDASFNFAFSDYERFE